MRIDETNNKVIPYYDSKKDFGSNEWIKYKQNTENRRKFNPIQSII